MHRHIVITWILCISAGFILSSANSRGLVNLGSTCYANSLIQSLYHTQEYRNNVLQKEFAPESAGAALREIFEKLQSRDVHSDVSAAALLRPLQLQHYKCEDVHEFYLNLLHKIDESDLTNSRLSSVFEGEQEDYVLCTATRSTAYQRVPFLALPITVAPDIDSLTTATERLRRVETISGENCAGSSLHGTKFVRIPKNLWFHLNRFTYNRSTNQVEKLPFKLSLPLILNTAVLDARLSEDMHLKSIIAHSGDSNRGHYKLFLRPLPSLLPEYWLLFDDSNVKEVSYEQVKRASVGNNKGDKHCSVAYMVQYTKHEKNETNIDDVVQHTLLSPIDLLMGRSVEWKTLG